MKHKHITYRRGSSTTHPVRDEGTVKGNDETRHRYV
jgi:hypothetical protein